MILKPLPCEDKNGKKNCGDRIHFKSCEPCLTEQLQIINAKREEDNKDKKDLKLHNRFTKYDNILDENIKKIRTKIHKNKHRVKRQKHIIKKQEEELYIFLKAKRNLIETYINMDYINNRNYKKCIHIHIYRDDLFHDNICMLDSEKCNNERANKCNKFIKEINNV